MFLLLRMKMLDGKGLIDQPSKTVSFIKLDFSEERDVDNMVHAVYWYAFNLQPFVA